MRTIYCDRCRKPCDGTPVLSLRRENGRVQLPLLIDLCPECIDSFEEWLRAEERALLEAADGSPTE